MATEYVDVATYRGTGWAPWYCSGHNRNVNYDGVNYGYAAPTVGTKITFDYLGAMVNHYKSELIRQERVDSNDDTVPGAVQGGVIDASSFHEGSKHLNNLTGTTGYATFDAGTNISTYNLGRLATWLETAGDHCVCYCNYGCTCYCNYSDERLKTEFTYL